MTEDRYLGIKKEECRCVACPNRELIVQDSGSPHVHITPDGFKCCYHFEKCDDAKAGFKPLWIKKAEEAEAKKAAENVAAIEAGSSSPS